MKHKNKQTMSGNHNKNNWLKLQRSVTDYLNGRELLL